MADVTVSDGDFIVTSSSESEDAIRHVLRDDAPSEDADDNAPAPEPAVPEPVSADAAQAADEQPADNKPKSKADARKKSIQAEIDDLTAKRRADALMPQTHAQNGQLAREML